MVCFTRLVPTQPLRHFGQILRRRRGAFTTRREEGDGACLTTRREEAARRITADGALRRQQSRRGMWENISASHGGDIPTGVDGEIELTPSGYCPDALRASSTIAFVVELRTRQLHTNAGPLPKQTFGSGGCHPTAYYDGLKTGFCLCSEDLTGCACGPTRGVSGSCRHPSEWSTSVTA